MFMNIPFLSYIIHEQNKDTGWHINKATTTTTS
jgi:hypothetical protein